MHVALQILVRSGAASADVHDRAAAERAVQRATPKLLREAWCVTRCVDIRRCDIVLQEERFGRENCEHERFLLRGVASRCRRVQGVARRSR